jgi:hypothetical protein
MMNTHEDEPPFVSTTAETHHPEKLSRLSIIRRALNGGRLRHRRMRTVGIVAISVVITYTMTLTTTSEPFVASAPTFLPVDRALGDNAGDAPARICAATAGYDPQETARLDALGRLAETQRSTNTLTRGTASIAIMQRCLLGRMVPSVTVTDLDGDHLPEVISLINTGAVELFWNNGGVFAQTTLPLFDLDTTGGPILGDEYQVLTVADVDGDGLNDLIASPHNGDQTLRILRNLGNRTFATELIRVPVEEHSGRPEGVTTADLNRDGIADIIQTLRTSYGSYNGNGAPRMVRLFLSTKGQAPYYVEHTEAMIPVATPDATRQSGSVAINAVRPYQPFVPIVTDFDEDGLEDLFLASDGGGSKILFRDGDKYVDYTQETLVRFSGAGMGASLFDFNLDGRLDVFVTEITYDYTACMYDRVCDYRMYGNTLFLGTGKRAFTDAAHEYGLANTGWGWGYAGADFNNDGYNDFFVGVGQNARGRAEEDWATIYQRPHLFLSGPDGRYTDATGTMFRSLHMLGTTQMIASADFDGDFRSDLLIGGEDVSSPFLLLNRTVTGNGALVVVKGRGLGGSPVNGEGSIITVEIPDRPIQGFQLPSRQTNLRLYGASYPIPIGLGEAYHAVVTVTYPSGAVVRRTIVANQVNIIEEPAAKRS